jgi:hypothetical protein
MSPREPKPTAATEKHTAAKIAARITLIFAEIIKAAPVRRSAARF